METLEPDGSDPLHCPCNEEWSSV